jgi:ATP-dependent protease HslVU (ClpYQ) peptidase subunit
MTCIVALKHDGRVYMGADSAGVGGWYNKSNRMDPKVYRVGQMLVGFTTSFRMGQLLGYSLSLPHHHPDVTVEKYMATSFIDAVRSCLKTGGFAEMEKNQEKGGDFLVAYRARIFHIYSDYQVGEREEPYDACGCGFDLALGSLYTSSVFRLEPRSRVETALMAAAAFSAGVCPPFRIEELSGNVGQKPPKPPPPPSGRLVREGRVPR